MQDQLFGSFQRGGRSLHLEGNEDGNVDLIELVHRLGGLEQAGNRLRGVMLDETEQGLDAVVLRGLGRLNGVEAMSGCRDLDGDSLGDGGLGVQLGSLAFLAPGGSPKRASRKRGTRW